MREVIPQVLAWLEEGKRAAIATVIDVEFSAPMGPGTSLAVCEDGTVVGSVSGGCVEPAVYEEARAALETEASKRLTYGISDDQAFEVGLTCGGTIHLMVVPVDAELQDQIIEISAAAQHEEPVTLTTVVTGPTAGASMLLSGDRRIGSLGQEGLDHAVASDAVGMADLGEIGLRTYGEHGERRPDDVEVFVHPFTPRPQMFIFGAIDFAAALCRIGRFLGYRVTVCDARSTFATRKRFPEADEVVVQWPHEFLAAAKVDARTVICVLTHDPKFDVPVLKAALETPAAYIGAMGSRKTHKERLDQLRETGLDTESLRRIASPIGLDIGSSTPEEVAIAIAGEIVAVRTGAGGGRLSDKDGPIHRQKNRLAADR